MKSNDEISLGTDLDYLFQDYDNNIEDKISNKTTTDSYFPDNLPSSIIQVTILLCITFMIFLFCKCNQCLEIFRQSVSDQYKNSIDIQHSVHYKDELRFRDYFSFFYFNRLKKRLFYCCFKRKHSYYNRRARRRIIEPHNFNKYYDRKKTPMKSYDKRRESILYRRGSIATLKVHRNRIYSSLKPKNNTTNKTQSLRLNSNKSSRLSFV
jgi:hypothetical protein